MIVTLLALIAFIVLATSRWNLHPFLALLLAALGAALAFGMEPAAIARTIGEGFGAIMGQIGLVIILGTVIGVILERSGAAITMAEAVIRLLGQRFPALTLSLIGYVVSIPVFCDSAYVILNSLKQAMATRMQASSTALSIALATGLYATHTFVPPTPGPIAAAGNLGLDNLGLLIGLGLVVSMVSALAGMAWANRFQDDSALHPALETPQAASDVEQERPRPGPLAAFAPIIVPIGLICMGSIAQFPSRLLGDGAVFQLLSFAGHPVMALAAGLLVAVMLLTPGERLARLHDHVASGISTAAPILLITGAGGAFGAILKATALGAQLGDMLLTYHLGLLAPFLIAAAFKSAQGSTTVALVATSALMAPLIADLGFDSDTGKVLMVLAIGAGAMTVSHANDSFFWVVSQFSRMPVSLAYRAFTTATLIQGLTGLATVYLLSLALPH